MTLKITIPAMDKGKSVKDYIISILSDDWPLSAKMIYNRIKKEGISVSYQAVHKNLKELLREGVLEKEDKRYKLGLEWIRNIKDFSGKLEGLYEDKVKLSIEKTLERGWGSFSFTNTYKFYLFMLDILDNLGSNYKDADGIGACQMKHFYWALASSEKEYADFRKMMQSYEKLYIICRNDTYADRMAYAYYKTFNPHTFAKFGIDCAKDFDIFSIGDFIIHVYFRGDVSKLFDSAYRNLKNVKTDNMKKFYEIIFNKETEISIIINRDPKIAEQLRNKILDYFKM